MAYFTEREAALAASRIGLELEARGFRGYGNGTGYCMRVIAGEVGWCAYASGPMGTVVGHSDTLAHWLDAIR